PCLHPLSLHDALPISPPSEPGRPGTVAAARHAAGADRAGRIPGLVLVLDCLLEVARPGAHRVHAPCAGKAGGAQSFGAAAAAVGDRKSTRLNSSHVAI